MLFYSHWLVGLSAPYRRGILLRALSNYRGPRVIKCARFLLVILFTFSLLLTPSRGQTQFFLLPGSFLYALNSINQVFDVDSSGTIGITLRNDPINVHTPLLTTFNPATGQPLDSKSFGFGPLGVKLAQIPE